MKKRSRAKRQPAEIIQKEERTPVPTSQRDLFLKELYTQSGGNILNRILGAPEPRKIIQGFSCQDFFWLVKKIGEKDSLSLLELASVDQWQYVLDMELWEKDRLDISHTSHWLNLLRQANCLQLVRWLFKEGEYLAYYHFLRTVEVFVINNEDDVHDLPEGFFSLDGNLYLRVNDPEYREAMENIIRVMASEDYNKYQSLFLGLSGVLPADVEEELYRLRNMRLAEQGFLPFDEAMAVYSPLEIGVLKSKEVQHLIDVQDDKDVRALIPVLPLAEAGVHNLLMDVVGGINDPIFLDRLRLEFAGLANQILSADGFMGHEIEVIIKACKKTARIVNLALEKALGNNTGSAVEILRRYPLVTLFRVGFGLVLKVKWEAERWLRQSWFIAQGLDHGFWGEHWGGILKGLLEKRPCYYVGPSEKEEYRDFEWLSDLSACLEVLRGLMVLDGLLEKVSELYRLKEAVIPSPEITFRPLLFNLWARLLLKVEPSFSAISLEQAKGLFSKMRGKEDRPPYRMDGFKNIFINQFMSHAVHSDPEAASILQNTLSQIWEDFREEYEQIPLDDLDPRYSRFVTIDLPH